MMGKKINVFRDPFLSAHPEAIAIRVLSRKVSAKIVHEGLHPEPEYTRL